MKCMECEKEIQVDEEYYEWVDESSYLCGTCFREGSYECCSDCGKVDVSENFKDSYCESCLEYHDLPEWAESEEDFEDFIKNHDPDR